MRHRVLTLPVTLLAFLAGSATLRAQTKDALADYPSRDGIVIWRIRAGLDAKRADERLASDPTAVGTIELLTRLERIDDLLEALHASIKADPARQIATLETLAPQLFRFRLEEARILAVREIVEPLRARVATLPREDAARLARAIASIDAQLAGKNDWRERMAEFAREYAGTAAALDTEVDLISRVDLRQRIDVLDRFWREHPGTVAGAKALYQKGFELGGNIATSGIEPRGSDPTARLMQVIEIANELTNGRYPPSEWVDRAPSLVTHFFVSQQPPPGYASGNLDRSIAAYRQFVRNHFTLDEIVNPISSGVGYILTSKMAELYRLRGDLVSGVEEAFADLERDVDDKSSVRLLRALFYQQQSISGLELNRAAMAGKAKAAFTTLADEGRGFAPRKALANLAADAFFAHDYATAIPLYQRFVTQYPDSAWSWVASLRIGQAHEARGEWSAAARAYLTAATTYRAQPLARVLGHAYAARVFDSLGQLDRSLAAYRRALDAWDRDYGAEYVLTETHPPVPTAPPGAPVDRSRVTKEMLERRVAIVERMARLPGGARIERGRWELDRGLHTDARATLTQFLKQFPRSPAAADARALLHRAQLEHALALAFVEGPAHDPAAAMAALDELVNEPFDFAVGAGRIAKATILAVRGAQSDAAALMKSALDEFVDAQRPLESRPAPSSLDADLVAIRNVVFHPTGNLAVTGGSWSAYRFPSSLPPFVLVNADVRVTLANRDQPLRTVVQRFPEIDRAIFFDTEQLSVIERLISTIGGTKRLVSTASVMAIPQPAAGNADVRAFWSQFFPMQVGHWGGWLLETFPMLLRIEFVDAGRTKANAMFRVGYSGATMVLEKTGGQWRAIRLTGNWIE